MNLAICAAVPRWSDTGRPAPGSMVPPVHDPDEGVSARANFTRWDFFPNRVAVVTGAGTRDRAGHRLVPGYRGSTGRGQRRRRVAGRRGDGRESGHRGVPGDRVRRWHGRAQPRLRQRLRGGRADHRHRGRLVRVHRHFGEQRRHCAGPHHRQDGRGRLRRRHRGAPEGHLQYGAPRRSAHEGGRLRAHRQHHQLGGAAGQLRADQLRGSQGSHHGDDVRVGPRNWAATASPSTPWPPPGSPA